MYGVCTYVAHPTPPPPPTGTTSPAHKNHSVRIAAIKLSEQTILQLTHPTFFTQLPNNKVLRAADITRVTDTHCAALAAMVKLPGFGQLSSALAIVVVRVVGSIAQARTGTLGRVLPPLLALANSDKYRVWDGVLCVVCVQLCVVCIIVCC